MQKKINLLEYFEKEKNKKNSYLRKLLEKNKKRKRVIDLTDPIDKMIYQAIKRDRLNNYQDKRLKEIAKRSIMPV